MISPASTGSFPGTTGLRDSDRIAFLRLRGTLDDRTVVSFKKSIFNIPAEKRILVLDLSRLEQATNAGISALLDALRFFHKRSGRIFLVQPNEELELLLLHFRAGDTAQLVRSYDEVLNLLPTSGPSSPAPGLESTLTELQAPNGPAVHYHYYGKDVPVPEADRQGVNFSLHDPLQELSTRLHHIQSLMEARPAGGTENVEQRLTEIAGAEGRMVDRLQKLEEGLRISLSRGIDDRLDRFEARILDRLDHVTVAGRMKSGEHNTGSLALPGSAGDSQGAPAPAATFTGYRMVPCQGCGAVLRIRQSGRHMCPSCEAEFTVTEKGEARF